MASAKHIQRITPFKIPNAEDQDKLLEIYRHMPEKGITDGDGKPYILAVKPGRAFPDQRAQGFTIAVVSVFSSVEDMKYYDNDCKAHAELKGFAKTVHQGVVMLYYESILD